MTLDKRLERESKHTDRWREREREREVRKGIGKRG
jgi:hypothetical protein